MTSITRRATLATAAALAASSHAHADQPDAWSFTFPAIEGGALALAEYRNRVLLVVNTASFCGFTYQYEALEKLHADLTPHGLTVVGIPSQDFNQEKDSNSEVKAFCELTYGVQFPMAGLSHVRGPEAHPFYQWVRAQQAGWQPTWNFSKVLIARTGAIAGHYGPTDEPGGPTLTKAIAHQLDAVT